MLDILLKGVELLLGKLKDASTPEKKREKLAKRLMQIYLNLEEIVHRGRELLSLYQKDPPESERSILLLTQQLRTLQELHNQLEQGVVGEILKLHLPALSKSLRCALFSKHDLVWVGLDLFVSDGHEITKKEWMSRLESLPDWKERSSMLPDGSMLFRPLFHQARAFPLALLTSGMEYAPSQYTMSLLGSPERISQGHEVLDRVQAVGEELRIFMLEKFKFEDVLWLQARTIAPGQNNSSRPEQ